MEPSPSDLTEHRKQGPARFIRWLAVDPVLAAATMPLDLIVQELARVLGVDWAFVGESHQGPPVSVRTVAWWRDGVLETPVEYPVAGSPCERVIEGVPCCCPRHVVQRFENAAIQESEGIQAYAAHPLATRSTEPFGLVGVMSRRPFDDPGRIRRLLAVCAPRVAGELAKLRTRDESGAARLRTGRRARERRLLARVREGDMLRREAYHRIKSNLQVVASLLTMQAGSSSDPALRDALAEAISRISAIALVHAQLSEHPSRGTVDMRVFVEHMIDNLQRTLDPSGDRVRLRRAYDPLTLPLRQAVPCGLLIAELVTNAFQHAFSRTGRGTIAVQVGATKTEATIVVRDNGRWLDEGHGGLGLHLIHLLATKQLRGHLTMDHTRGTVFTVRFAIEATHRGSDQEVVGGQRNKQRSTT